jgi:hypothetical protein
MRSFGVAIEIEDGSMVCGACRHRLGSTASGYEEGATVVAVPSGALGPQVAEDQRLDLVLYLCPDCGQCLKATSARTGEGRLADARGLDATAGESR